MVAMHGPDKKNNHVKSVKQISGVTRVQPIFCPSPFIEQNLIAYLGTK